MSPFAQLLWGLLKSEPNNPECCFGLSSSLRGPCYEGRSTVSQLPLLPVPLCCLAYFKDRASLCSPGCPDVKGHPLFVSQVMELEAFTTS